MGHCKRRQHGLISPLFRALKEINPAPPTADRPRPMATVEVPLATLALLLLSGPMQSPMDLEPSRLAWLPALVRSRPTPTASRLALKRRLVPSATAPMPSQSVLEPMPMVMAQLRSATWLRSIRILASRWAAKPTLPAALLMAWRWATQRGPQPLTPSRLAWPARPRATHPPRWVVQPLLRILPPPRWVIEPMLRAVTPPRWVF